MWLTDALLSSASSGAELYKLQARGLSDLVVQCADICARISGRDVNDKVSDLAIEVCLIRGQSPDFTLDFDDSLPCLCTIP